MKTIYDFEEQAQVITPQLVYYPEMIRTNIGKMIALAGGVERLWPHIKTHKMEKVVEMLLSMGIDKCKCATIAEAEMCARAGVKKVCVAYPMVGPNTARFVKLMKAYPYVTFYTIGDDAEQVAMLGAAAAAESVCVNMLADVDMGQHRTGVPIENVRDRFEAWDRLPGIHMAGMHCYDGHRHEKDPQTRLEETEKVDSAIEIAKGQLLAQGLDCRVLIMGGTPSFPCHARLTGEYLSPGTCVIGDMGYSDSFPDLDFSPAAAIMTRVVSRPMENRFTMDMGTKAVASDPPYERARIVGMEYCHTVVHNEEHWVVEVPKEHIGDIPPIGTELFAIPAHICPCAPLYPEVPAVEGGHLKEWWTVTARNRKITI